MAKRTPLYEKHLQANGKMVDFGGWDMPVNYGSQIQELTSDDVVAPLVVDPVGHAVLESSRAAL